MTDGNHGGTGPEVKPDFRHAVPVLAIVAVAVAAALTVRHFLVPKTFGEYGHYRAAAMDDEKERQPRHVGRAVCATCHEDVSALHAKDAHASIECEACHGPGWKHVKNTDEPMRAASGRDECLVCHRHLDARPGAFPQVVWEQHYQFVGVANLATACVRCHSGHEPLYSNRDLHTARLHPLIQQCVDCHVGRTDKTLKKPDTHPQIFECNYCHVSLAKSFRQGAHSKLDCTACHLFIKENAFSGRIVRNNDPRFCLLCHSKADFRSPSGPPTIVWPQHIKDVSSDPVDPKRACVTCHQEQVHEMYSKEVSHGL